MNDNSATVFHGFLNLDTKEKLAVVEAINEYFDSMDRDPIRAENEVRFREIADEAAFRCKCCGR
jgi:hypothetical protein